MEITWLSQMGLLIRSKNTAICIDYFASPDEERLVKAPIEASKLTGINAFLGTHDHLDHIDHEAWKIWARVNPEARFLFPRACEASVLADGIDKKNAVGLNDGETVKIGDMTIHAIAASHEFLDRDEETGLYPYLQYIIEAEGFRIHHAGDTVRYEGMLGKILNYGPVDLELLPINGRDAKRYLNNCIGNMTYQEAADLAGDVGTHIVIPGHWDMFPGNTADPQEFSSYIAAKYGDRIDCRILKTGEKIIL
ncbi:MAG: MBL fold metallo-hydrolase [Lachnospiraceae bacterium]|nr:MBL fold metallo-hydrolase [Lachnospiraceae bacterium]